MASFKESAAAKRMGQEQFKGNNKKKKKKEESESEVSELEEEKVEEGGDGKSGA